MCLLQIEVSRCECRALGPHVKHVYVLILEAHLLLWFLRESQRGDPGAGVASGWEGLAVTLAEQNRPLAPWAAQRPSQLAPVGVGAAAHWLSLAPAQLRLCILLCVINTRKVE